jgi:hypothetical protein
LLSHLLATGMMRGGISFHASTHILFSHLPGWVFAYLPRD